MTPTPDTLSDLYSDTKTCAKLVGLNYIESEAAGFTRIKHGKGFTYKDAEDRLISDAELKARIAGLVIPPAWQEVWICPTADGHVLATGIDERGRKQYIYHPKWRTMRDLIKFYRMILFASTLSNIRRFVSMHLDEPELTRDKVMAIMLWILDNAYIRVGSEVYYQQNDSVGLTTLTDKNIVIAGPVVTLSFKGKSGKDQQITFENKTIAGVLDELRQVRGARLFRYADSETGVWRELDAEDINTFLHELTGQQISAKDFRTWGGTLMAFLHLVEEDEASRKKPEKVIVEAVDQAAAVLGNTRSVARSSYVHPHILDTYGSKNFSHYYEKARKTKRVRGLDARENELLAFLEQLFQEEFDLLQKR